MQPAVDAENRLRRDRMLTPDLTYPLWRRAWDAAGKEL